MLELKILLIPLFAFIIHFIGTLSYSVRIVGVRTGKIALSFSLFNIFVLFSRTANTFLNPLLSKNVETNIANQNFDNNIWLFRIILLAASLATLAGIFLIPMFQRLFSLAVTSYSEHKSMKRLLLRFFSIDGISDVKRSFVIPNRDNIKLSAKTRKGLIVPFLLNIIIVAILSVGSLSSLYAGYLVPEFRSTANSLHSIVNGLATVLLFLIVDPYLAGMTDDVVSGKIKESIFRKNVVFLSISRFLGTLLAQLLLYPSALIIAQVSKLL
ncbi:lipid II flippase family protein [Spirochaeta isovalerica]|uniref:Lipid II flippase Amj n=1 Tax=Spirochaeta isovalerica TaxID=150 RepID=A0A841RKD9_9SPIO|nr:DUF2837 family protein [Spirochaeta isovalerica]MBB6482732.1 hypothetical protein [Spirochaeta isovalerica]